jgi:hypothetical protein
MLTTDPLVESRLADYHAKKIAGGANLDNRVYLGHLINYYTSAVNAKLPFNATSISKQIDDQLSHQFNITLDTPLELAQQVIQAQSMFDLGKTVPYSLPSYLYKHAEYLKSRGITTKYDYELAALIAAKGLEIDFRNLFHYKQILRLSRQQADICRNSAAEVNPINQQLCSMTESIISNIPELNEKPLSLLSRIKRKLRILSN